MNLILLVMFIFVATFGLFMAFGLLMNKGYLFKSEIAKVGTFYTVVTILFEFIIVGLFGINIYSIIGLLVLNVLMFYSFYDTLKENIRTQKLYNYFVEKNKIINGIQK